MSTKYNEWRHRAENAIAHGALTNSKRPSVFVEGVYPTHAKSGHGPYLYDANGKKFVDFIGALGSSILGYAHDEIIAAAHGALKKGATLSLGTTEEVELAELVKGIVPFVERVRFLKTGSEACAASLRIARAFTQRYGVLTHGYHGWHDEFTSLTPPAFGVPRPFEYIGFLDVANIPDLEGIGAVIIEPVLFDYSEARRKWLQELRDKCTRSGTMLIFDEVITGFRTPKLSVSAGWGIEPDLIVMGKAMANGLPIAMVGGKKDIMNSDYFVSSTFAGDMTAIAAAKKTIQLLMSPEYDMNRLWEAGATFLNKFNSLWPENLRIIGYPTRGKFEGDPQVKARFWQEACKAGILFGPSFFFNFSHIGEEDAVLNTCQDIMTRLKTRSVKLEGAMPVMPEAAKARG